MENCRRIRLFRLCDKELKNNSTRLVFTDMLYTSNFKKMNYLVFMTCP